jgi:hypothetical protein
VAGSTRLLNITPLVALVRYVREQEMMAGHPVEPINVIASEAKQSILSLLGENGLLRAQTPCVCRRQ